MDPGGQAATQRGQRTAAVDHGRSLSTNRAFPDRVGVELTGWFVLSPTESLTVSSFPCTRREPSFRFPVQSFGPGPAAQDGFRFGDVDAAPL